MGNRRPGVFGRGLMSGAVGFLVISAYYALVNIIFGRSAFATLRGISHAFFNTRDGGPASLIVYSGVHLAAWLTLGCIASLFVKETGTHPRFWYVMFFIFLLAFIFSDTFLSTIVGPVTGLGPFTILLGNLIAAAAVGASLYRATSLRFTRRRFYEQNSRGSIQERLD